MGKKFDPNAGTYVSVFNHLSHIQELHTKAVEAAVEGDFGLSFSLILKALRVMPRMPTGWESHELVLDKIQFAMDESMKRGFGEAATSLNEDVSELFEGSTRDNVSKDLVSETLLLYVREFEMYVQMAFALGQIRLVVSHILREGRDVSEKDIQQLAEVVP